MTKQNKSIWKRLTLDLFKNGVSKRANDIDERPYNTNKMNSKNRLALTKTLDKGKTMMQIIARTNTYTPYMKVHDNLWKIKSFIDFIQ